MTSLFFHHCGFIDVHDTGKKIQTPSMHLSTDVSKAYEKCMEQNNYELAAFAEIKYLNV